MEKVWLITGCSTGFGRELAAYVLSQGDKVAVTARNVDDIQDLLVGYPGSAIALKLDVTNAVQVKDAVRETQFKFGRIDVLVNNAGIGSLVQ